MNGSIFASILYTIAFVAFYVTMLLLKKSERKFNGVSWLVFTLLIELCWSGLIVAIINIVHIPINIWSVGIIYLLSAILVGIKIYREKEIQKYEWNLYDILVSVGVFVTVALMLYRRVGVGLQLNMINSDAAVHLKNAVSVVLEQKLPTMYFAPFQTAMVLEVTMPWVAIYNFYKVFMIVDAILFVFWFVMHYGGVEEKVVAHSARFQEEIRSSEFFHIYDYNLAYMQVNNTNFKEDYMEMCKYIVDELETSKDVPLIATMENYATCYWYEAITGEDSSDYYGWWYSFDDVSKKLEKQKVEYFAMCKDSPVWENHEDYFKEYPVVFENENSVVYSAKR